MSGSQQLLLGGVKASDAVYIEDVFSTYLYTGNGSTQTINNGIYLAGKGGLVWLKSRSAATSNFLFDTARGTLNELNSNTTDAQASLANSLTGFNANGFALGSAAGINVNAATYASWTFRKQPKFFDVVTYTGNGSTFQTVSHNLGSTPGCIIVKQTNSGSTNWVVYHREIAADTLRLNLTNAKTGLGGNVLPSSTSVDFYGSGAGADPLNASGGTYVAYLFAHNAGGFGLSGTDNVISCGSFTGNGSATGPVVSLGYEPQWLMVKNATGTGNWQIIDNMRGMSVGSADATLQANLSNAESSVDYVSPTATGFQVTSTSTQVNTNASTYIYIAIRRGPMKVPTNGTSVYKTVLSNPTNSGAAVTGAGFPPDLNISLYRGGSVYAQSFFDRLRGGSQYLSTASTAVEGNVPSDTFLQDGFYWGSASGESLANTFMRRAPGFFDVVCYTGTGVARTVTHNLGVAPELVLLKNRSVVAGWIVVGNVFPSPTSDYLSLTSTAASGFIANLCQAFTATTFGFGSGIPNNSSVNAIGNNYVAYLFASCPGVSKVGSYTGTGTTQQINCGFTAGARFVLIKRTDSTGDWYVWDSARGIVAGNDPYLLLNSTAAEVTSTDYVDTYSAGFEISSTAPAAINANGGTFIYLAIA